MFATAGLAALAEELRQAAIAKAAAEAEVDKRWEALYKALDAKYGPNVAASIIWEDANTFYKVGRFNQMRGAGTDPDALALGLKKALKPEHYRRLVVEEQSVIYNVNHDAVKAAGALDPIVAAIIEAATSEGSPVLTKIPPEKAAKDAVKQAEAALKAQVPVGSSRRSA